MINQIRRITLRLVEQSNCSGQTEFKRVWNRRAILMEKIDRLTRRRRRVRLACSQCRRYARDGRWFIGGRFFFLFVFFDHRIGGFYWLFRRMSRTRQNQRVENSEREKGSQHIVAEGFH